MSVEVHDAILFSNEIELLEIRLHELRDVVDRFVVVEATRTFRGEPKPLVFDQYRRRFAGFEHRLEHVVVDDLPGGDDPWAREWHQRNAVARAFTDCAPDSIVMLSDADELPSRTAVETLRTAALPAGLVQPVHYGWIDVRSVAPESHVRWIGTRATTVGEFAPQGLRELGADDLATVIDAGGWHFSYLGGVDRVRAKLESYAHSENDRDDVKATFHDALRGGTDPFGRAAYRYEQVPVVAGAFPDHLVQNLSSFEHLVLGG